MTVFVPPPPRRGRTGRWRRRSGSRRRSRQPVAGLLVDLAGSPASSGSSATVSLHHGMTTWLKQLEDSARACSRNGICRCGSRRAPGSRPQVGGQPAQLRLARPGPSWREKRDRRVERRAGVSGRPGSASRANARSGGKDALRLASAGRPPRARRGSSAIALCSASSWAAKEPVTMRRLVTRSWSCGWLRSSARGDASRSCGSGRRGRAGWVPSSASLTCDGVLEGAGRRCGRARAGPRRRRTLRARRRAPRSRSCRLPRTSACSVVRIWSSWTEFEVWLIGNVVAVRRISGALGLPGLDVDEQVALEEQARAQLQVRVGRGSGGPSSSISIVTTTRPPGPYCDVRAERLDLGDLADVDAGDPHRALRGDVLGVREDRLDLVAAAVQRQLLREREEKPTTTSTSTIRPTPQFGRRSLLAGPHVVTAMSPRRRRSAGAVPRPWKRRRRGCRGCWRSRTPGCRRLAGEPVARRAR